MSYKHAIIDKELLSIAVTLLEHKTILCGAKIILYSDYKNLIHKNILHTNARE